MAQRPLIHSVRYLHRQSLSPDLHVGDDRTLVCWVEGLKCVGPNSTSRCSVEHCGNLVACFDLDDGLRNRLDVTRIADNVWRGDIGYGLGVNGLETLITRIKK